jgi:hypothetical protein
MEVHNKRLTLGDRKLIEKLLYTGMKHKELCEKVGIARSTLYREFKKCKDIYNAEEAHNNTGRSKNLIDWDIIGKRFGLLTVESFACIQKRRSWWHCMCDCGYSVIESRKKLTDYCSKKRPLSCGCIPKQWKSKKEKIPFEEIVHRKYLDLLSHRKIVNECWEWQGYINKKSKIPMCSWRNKTMTVRKCMYLLTHMSTFEPNLVYASCGNRKCFNPDHIVLGIPPKRNFYKDIYD